MSDEKRIAILEEALRQIATPTYKPRTTEAAMVMDEVQLIAVAALEAK